MVSLVAGMSMLGTKQGAHPSPGEALYNALVQDDARAVRRAVHEGASLSVAAKGQEEPPLFFALTCRQTMFNLVRRLGAPIAGRDTHGRTLLHLLVSDPFDLPWYPSPRSDGPVFNVRTGPPLSYGPWPWREELAKDLLRHGLKIDARDDLGRTPLHYAVLAGWRGVNLMLSLNEIIFPRTFLFEPRQRQTLYDAQDAAGETPLILFANPPNLGFPQVAREAAIAGLLLEAGADLNIRDNSGMTAEDWAVKNGDVVLAAILRGKRLEPPGP